MITTMDQLVEALATASPANSFDSTMPSKGSGYFQSLWQASGNPGSGATPPTGAGAALTNATPGAIPYTNPGAGLTGYLGRFFAVGTSIATVMLYDRLVTTSGLSGVLTTAQTVNSAALTRYTSGAGVQAWLEFYGATGATPTTASISYTNQAGTAGQIGSAPISASLLVGTLIPITLAAGDTGVQSVQSVTLAASTGTAGNFGVTLGYVLAWAPVPRTAFELQLDYADLGLPQIQNSACLALADLGMASASLHEFVFVQG